MNNSLADVFKIIYSSIVDASNEIDKHWVGEIKEDYFDKDGKPHMMPIELPTGQNGEMKKIDIPVITLVPHNGMAINEVEIEMKVALSVGDDKDINNDKTTKKKPGKIRQFLTDLSKRNEGKELAKIKVKFHGKEAPEGLARIKDSLVKIIPN